MTGTTLLLALVLVFLLALGYTGLKAGANAAVALGGVALALAIVVGTILGVAVADRL